MKKIAVSVAQVKAVIQPMSTEAYNLENIWRKRL